ncbi:uncharacterized protein [Haliotis cracherodii]|uniref:uncharacterized protein n=1 Tax=Haliotis cracherodii TaxID=6455 RepID=UPI0039EB011E
MAYKLDLLLVVKVERSNLHYPQRQVKKLYKLCWMRGVSCKIDKIQRSNDDMNLKLQTVESTLKVVLEQISETSNRCQTLEEENFHLKDQMKAMDDKLDYLENMSRRNNLIFHGVPRGNETQSLTDCELIVKDVLRNDLQLLDDVNIQRAHRIMKGKAIIVKLADDKDKQAILRASKALKDTGMFITEDFSPLVRQKRKKFLPRMFQARESGFKVFLRFDKLYTVTSQDFHVQ